MMAPFTIIMLLYLIHTIQLPCTKGLIQKSLLSQLQLGVESRPGLLANPSPLLVDSALYQVYPTNTTFIFPTSDKIPSQYEPSPKKVRLPDGSSVKIYSQANLSRDRVEEIENELAIHLKHRLGVGYWKKINCFCKLGLISSKSADILPLRNECVCDDLPGKKDKSLNTHNMEDFFHQNGESVEGGKGGGEDGGGGARGNNPKYPLTLKGLVLSLDAADPSCYVKGGEQTWHNSNIVLPENNNGVIPVGRLPLTIVYTDEAEGAFNFFSGPIKITNIDISASNMNDVSLEVWVKLNSISNNRGEIFGNRLAEFKGRGINMHDVRFGGSIALCGAGRIYKSAFPKPDVDKWYHIVGIWKEGGYSYIYVNGIKQQIVNSRTHSEDGTEYLTIGSESNKAINGWTAAVSVYNRAISSYEIVENYCTKANRFKVDDSICSKYLQ